MYKRLMSKLVNYFDEKAYDYFDAGYEDFVAFGRTPFNRRMHFMFRLCDRVSDLCVKLGGKQDIPF